MKDNFGLTTDTQVSVALHVNIKEIFKYFLRYYKMSLISP